MSHLAEPATYTFKVYVPDATGRVDLDNPEIITAPVIGVEHCQQCGSTDPEDIDTIDDDDLQGYTACCNERVVDGGSCNDGNDDCSHRGD